YPRRRLTGDCFSLFQKVRHAVGVPFVSVVAKRMTQFVANREIKKAHPVHVPLQQQFAAPPWYFRHERFFDERLALRVKRKRWAVWIKSPGHVNGLPVLGTHQHPGPISKPRYRVFGEGSFENSNVLAALLQGVADVAYKML